MKISQPLRELIETGPLAHFVTLNKDGSPHMSAVWIGLDGDDIMTAHLPENQKVKNIKRNPKVVFSIAATTKSAYNLTEYAVIHGHAVIEQGGAPELLQKLAYVYIAPGVKFPPMDNPPPGYIARIRVERVSGVGPWVTG